MRRDSGGQAYLHRHTVQVTLNRDPAHRKPIFRNTDVYWTRSTGLITVHAQRTEVFEGRAA